MYDSEGIFLQGFTFDSDDQIHVGNDEGTEYVRIDAEEEGGAVVRILRKGYCDVDYAQEDATSVLFELPVDGGLLNADNLYEPHSLTFDVCTGALAISLDGTLLDDGTEPYEAINERTNEPYMVEPPTSFIVNPAGSADPGGSTIDPRMNDVGFYAVGGAQVTDMTITNYDAPYAELFGAETGATYALFDGLAGVEVSEEGIRVADTLVYADPSHGSVPYVRRDFEVDGEVTNAMLYVTARGALEYYINGERVVSDTVYYVDDEGKAWQEDWFVPGVTEFYATLNYATYDVTDMIQEGGNAMGAIMSSGWYGDESYWSAYINTWGDNWGLLSKLVLTFADGSTQTIVSDLDSGWTVSNDGPIRYSGRFHGETYDANKEAAMEGWATYGYDDSAWQDVVYVPTVNEELYADAALVAKPDQPVHVYEIIEPVDSFKEVRQFGDNEESVAYVFNMGTNMVGVPSITFHGLEAGDTVYIRYAEWLYPELAEDNEYNYGDLAGLIQTENYRGARSMDTYTAKGVDGETFTPSFTYHGWQYMELSGDCLTDEIIDQIEIEGIVLTSVQSISSTYEATTADDNATAALTNQLFKNIVRSTLGNHVGIATDCPQRNERLGFTGDAQVYSNAAVYIADIAQFYGYYGNTISDSADRAANRSFPSFAPDFMNSNLAYAQYDETATNSSICWAVAGVFVPYQTWMQYGDTTIIADMWDNICMFMRAFANNVYTDGGYTYLFNGGGLADHLSVVSTDSAYCQTVTYVNALKCCAEMAQAAGFTEANGYGEYNSYEYFQELYLGARAEFNERMINDDFMPTNLLGDVQNTQTAFAMPLAWGLVDEENLEGFLANYVAVCADSGEGIPAYSITTGFVGTNSVLNALTDNGEVETAYSMFECTDYASWLYPVVQGATSIWERWNSFTIEDGFAGNNGMNSANHYSLGACGSWMMDTQVGIERGDEPGFKHFVLQPTPGGSYTSLTGSYDSVYGVIESAWTADAGALTSYDCVIPANTTATIYLPVEAEVGELPAGLTCVGAVEHNGRTATQFEAVSGAYSFVIADGVITAALKDGYIAA